MAQELNTQTRSEGAYSAADFPRNRELFTQYNRTRFRSVHETFPENYQLIFKLVPFLLHTNIRGFPGYVDSAETPCAIKQYQPDGDTSTLIQKYFSKGVKFTERKDMGEGFIEFLSVMGSVGSIAQTNKSDFDIWVGINRDDADDSAFKLFQQKLRAVEEWLMKMRLEVHFFPTDIKSVSNNVFGAVDDESCGSAQALMLKDEFYRTAILIAGKMPFWWMVRPGVGDEDYRAIRELCRQNATCTVDTIDIGNLSSIHKDEFFGAALWQLVKSLKSPFKSFIKMCLMERYLFGDTSNEVTLLSNRLKENVLLKQELDSNSIDGYLLMFRTIEDFFLETHRMGEAEMLRQCFYLKVQPNLSSLNIYASAGSQKRLVMGRQIENWKWDKEKLQKLDTFYKWPMDDILKFDQQLKKFMIQSFSILTSSRDLVGNSSLITQDDLNIITRKLLSYYTPKPKKLRHFCFSFDDSYAEPELTVTRGDVWQLHRGEVKRAARPQQAAEPSNVLHSGAHLSDLCLWIAYGKLFNPFYSKLTVYSADSGIAQKDVTALIGAMAEMLHENVPARSDYFLGDPFMLKALVTTKLDPADDNDRFGLFYLNSWHELFAEHCGSQADLYPLFNDLVCGFVRSGMPDPAAFVRFHATAGGMKELAGLKAFVGNMLAAIRKKHIPGQTATVYVSKLDEQMIAYAVNGSHVRHARHPSIFTLLDMIYDKSLTSPVQYLFDATVEGVGLAQLAASSGRAGRIDLFVATLNAQMSMILISDELNRLAYVLAPADRLAGCVDDLRLFYDSVKPQAQKQWYEMREVEGRMAAVPREAQKWLPDGGLSCGVVARAVRRSAAAENSVINLLEFDMTINDRTYALNDKPQLDQFLAACRQVRASVPALVVQLIPDVASLGAAADPLWVKLTLQKQLDVVLR